MTKNKISQEKQRTFSHAPTRLIHRIFSKKEPFRSGPLILIEDYQKRLKTSEAKIEILESKLKKRNKKVKGKDGEHSNI